MMTNILKIIISLAFAGIIGAICFYFEAEFLTKYSNDNVLQLVLRILYYLSISLLASFFTYFNFFKKPKSKEPCPECGKYRYFETKRKLSSDPKKASKGLMSIRCKCKNKKCNYSGKHYEAPS